MTRGAHARLANLFVWVSLATLPACGGGSGEGLDQNGQPVGQAPAPAPSMSGGALTPDLASIQRNVFTPMCASCHGAAIANQGMRLDEGNSFSSIVNADSQEIPALKRIEPGDPDNSYLIQKLRGGSTIAGARMPLGGPFLSQAAIDTIAQWVANGAPMN
jgi:mono/diheme cytochrome c family protein